MKYFTKEELEEITKELIENPTRETLKKLNEKYNGSMETVSLEKEIPAVDTPIMESQENENYITSTSVIEPVEVSIPTSTEFVGTPILNTNIPNVEIPKMEDSLIHNNVNVSSPGIPSFDLPKLEAPANNVQNNDPINFTGNIFDTQPSVANLMQTTDNFNSVPNTMPTTEVPVTGTPFFGPHIAGENNPIPVGGPANNMPASGPSMFGQIEQNYM